ncbi:MAG: NUDIX domain-containing protein, partial [Planctomycetes bacterium]|nr:NUDIX domain-containing protein [Planctomycetota bacterium]
LADTAKREVFEETGVRVIVERPLYLREFIAPRHKRLTRDMPPDRHVLGLIFLCRPDPAVHGAKAPSAIGSFPGAVDGTQGVTGIEWMKLNDLAQVEITPPHIKRVLLGDFPPPPERGIEFWPDVD